MQTADSHDGVRCSCTVPCAVLLSLVLRLFPGELAFNNTSRLDNHNRQRYSLWGPVTWPCLINFGGVTGWRKHGSPVMFCAVKVIDREGQGTVRCFQNTFDFYWGQSSVTEATLAHCGRVVPSYNTSSWPSFTELCCRVCQQYFASKALQRRYYCFKTLPFDMWKRDWCGSESELESELESESIFPSRSRSRWNLVDSAALASSVI